MHAHQGRYHVSMMCKYLNVSKAGYYAWRRKQSNRRKADVELLNPHSPDELGKQTS
jgi:hypothetical protein